MVQVSGFLNFGRGPFITITGRKVNTFIRKVGGEVREFVRVRVKGGGVFIVMV